MTPPPLFLHWWKILASEIVSRDQFQNFNQMVIFISGSCRKNVFWQNLSYRSFAYLDNWRGSARLNFNTVFKKLKKAKILYYKICCENVLPQSPLRKSAICDFSATHFLFKKKLKNLTKNFFKQITDFSSGSCSKTFLQQMLRRNFTFLSFLKELLKLRWVLPLQLSRYAKLLYDKFWNWPFNWNFEITHLIKF